MDFTSVQTALAAHWFSACSMTSICTITYWMREPSAIFFIGNFRFTNLFLGTQSRKQTFNPVLHHPRQVPYSMPCLVSVFCLLFVLSCVVVSCVVFFGFL